MRKPGAPTTHPVHDVLHAERQPLDAFFSPQSVAVIGATDKPGSVGRAILRNLVTTPSAAPSSPSIPSARG